MRVTKSRILNEERYLGEIQIGQKFRLICPVTSERLAKSGFPENPILGLSVLPSIVGPTSRFNAEGKEIARRDLPKENRYLGTRYTRRSEFRGRYDREVNENLIDIYRLCYPRDLIPPPGIELTLIEDKGQKYFSTPALEKRDGNGPDNRHAINLMLELFREAEVVRDDLERLTPPLVKRANWTLLPPGEQPFERIADHIKSISARRPLIAKFALERQEFIVGLEPSHAITGNAGFSNYIAYVFESRGVTVLESISVGNAIYILGADWAEVSRLTKAEILAGKLHEVRIIHAKGWRANLVTALRQFPPRSEKSPAE